MLFLGDGSEKANGYAMSQRDSKQNAKSGFRIQSGSETLRWHQRNKVQWYFYLKTCAMISTALASSSVCSSKHWARGTCPWSFHDIPSPAPFRGVSQGWQPRHGQLARRPL